MAKSLSEKPRPPYGLPKRDRKGWILVQRAKRAALNYKGVMPKIRELVEEIRETEDWKFGANRARFRGKLIDARTRLEAILRNYRIMREKHGLKFFLHDQREKFVRELLEKINGLERELGTAQED